MGKSSGLRESLLCMWNGNSESCRVLLAYPRVTASRIPIFPIYMGKARQVSRDILCLIVIHSADADSERLKSDVCHIDRLVLNEILRKIHYGEMCWYSPDGQGRFKTTPHPGNVDVWRWKQRGNERKTWCKGKIWDMVGATASRLQCSQAYYSEDLHVWICLFSPQHLPITHSR